MRKNLMLSAIAGFNTALSFTLVSSFLPIYLDLQGISLTNIGLIFAFGAMLAGVLRFPIGTITDRIGRRPLMLLGAIGYPIFAIGIVLSHSTAQFVSIKLLIELFGALFWTAFWAYIYDVLRRGHEGRDISFAKILLGISCIIAPFAGGIIITYYGFTHLFYLAAVIGLVNILFVWLIVRESNKSRSETLEQFEHDLVKEYKDIISIKKFRIYLTIGALHNIVWVVWWVYMPIHLNNIGISFQQIGILLSAMYLAYVIFMYPLGKLIDKLPSKYIIIPGFLLVWISGYFFLLAKDFLGMAASRVAMGVGFDVEWSPLVARLSHITPRREHGGTVGLFRAGTAIVAGIVTVIAGWLAEIYGIKTVLWGASSLALVFALVLIFINSGLKEKGRGLLAKHHVINLHHKSKVHML